MSNMFVQYALTAVLAYAVGAFFVIQKRIKETKRRLPPSPDCGFLEYVINLLSPNGPLYALEIARKIGYISCTPGMPNLMNNFVWVNIADPTLARAVLEDSQATKPWQAYEFFDKACGGENFFTANGPRANHVRKSTSAAFSTQNVKKMENVVEDVLDRWIEERLEPLYVKTGKGVDFDEEMMIVTTDVIARAGFDHRLTPDERLEFSNKMRTIMTVFFGQNLSITRKFFGFMFSDIREARRLVTELKNKFGHAFLNSCRNNPNPSPGTIVHLMLQDNQYDNDDQRARDIMLYFFAGFETTAHAIAWAMLELARNPKEQSKLRTAIHEHVKNSSSAEKPDLKQCPQVKLVARESMRLHPTAALGSSRVIPRELSINNPQDKSETWVIPKGSLCNVISYVVLRNHHVFGDNADRFDSSRWESPTDDMLKAYLPFAAGKRNCQGMALAYLELHYVIARLTSRYNFTIDNEGHPTYLVTLRPEGSTILVRPLDA